MIFNSVSEKVDPRKKPEPAKKRWSERVGYAVDSFIADIAPSWGSKRLVARRRNELISQQVRLFEQFSYSWPGAASSESRDYRYLGTRSSPDDAIEHDRERLVERCTELYRGNTVAHSAIEGRVAYEVGMGLTRYPRVRKDKRISKDRAEEINTSLKDIIDRWSDHGVDKRRRLSLSATQRLACRTYAVYGEVFVILSQSPFKGSIGLSVDIISPERVETPPERRGDPYCKMGVQYTANDEIKGYWVRHVHPDARTQGLSYRKRVTYKFVPRFDKSGHARMIHVFDPLFPEQSRGIPWLATAMNRMKDLDDFFEAELIAKQVEACFGLIIKTNGDAGTPVQIAEGNANADTRTNEPRLRSEDLTPGSINYINTDEDAVTVNPDRPGSTFAPFIEAGLRSIAASLNYPYEVLAKNFFRTTFSSGRLAMLDGWMGFSMRQQVLIEQMMRPIYRRIVNDAVFLGELEVDLLDYLDRPHVYERHRWIGQGRGFIDPDKEVRAAISGNQGGITTKAEIYTEKGADWEDAEEQLDVEERKKIALRIAREVWEDEERERQGLKPINRQYTEEAGGTVKVTTPEAEPPSEQQMEDAQVEATV